MLWLLACVSPPVSTVVEARGGGAALWSPHTPTAVLGALELDLEGLEFDVVLTRDGVPVLAPGDVLNEGCVVQAPLQHPVVISATDYETLNLLVRCGAAPHPDFPNQVVRDDRILRLDQVLRRLRRDAPLGLRVHMHMHPSTNPEQKRSVADGILEEWRLADPPQSLTLSAISPELLRATVEAGRRRTIDATHFLRLHAEDEANPTLPSDAIEQALDAGADGVGVHWEALRGATVQQAQRNGLHVMSYPVNEAQDVAQARSWHLFSVLTDFPGDHVSEVNQP